MGKGAEANNSKLRKLGKEGPTKHPDTPEGGAWGCGMFAPPASARGEDKRRFNEHGEIFSWRNFWGTGGLYMCFVVYVSALRRSLAPSPQANPLPVACHFQACF